MSFAWKFLFPLSIVNLFVVALEVYFLGDGQSGLTQADLGIMAVINLCLTGVAVVAYGRLFRNRVQPPAPVSQSITVTSP